MDNPFKLPLLMAGRQTDCCHLALAMQEIWSSVLVKMELHQYKDILTIQSTQNVVSKDDMVVKGGDFTLTLLLFLIW